MKLTTLFLLALVACGHRPPAKRPAHPLMPPEYASVEPVEPVVITVEKVVVKPCMAPPPDVLIPSWPTADLHGQRLVQPATADAFNEALREYKDYIDRQYAACIDTAKTAFEEPLPPEEPLDDPMMPEVPTLVLPSDGPCFASPYDFHVTCPW